MSEVGLFFCFSFFFSYSGSHIFQVILKGRVWHAVRCQISDSQCHISDSQCHNLTLLHLSSVQRQIPRDAQGAGC